MDGNTQPDEQGITRGSHPAARRSDIASIQFRCGETGCWAILIRHAPHTPSRITGHGSNYLEALEDAVRQLARTAS